MLATAGVVEGRQIVIGWLRFWKGWVTSAVNITTVELLDTTAYSRERRSRVLE